MFVLPMDSSLIFFGLMHVTFNVQNNLYRLVDTPNQMRT